jgi:calcium-translocating P-type ATPase
MKSNQNKLSDLFQQLNSNLEQGLSYDQAQERLAKIGKNELQIKKSPSIFYTFLLQFAEPLIYLLLAAASIIFFVGQSLDAFIICGILIFNGIIGTIQAQRTEKILDGLESFLTNESIVIRDGISHIIASNLLVPGDIIQVSAGEKIPADAQVITATNLSVNESILTGESTPTTKQAAPSDNKEFTNILFSGTDVISGQATAIIFATGKSTEIGKIHTTTTGINTQTALQDEMEKLSHWILMFVLVICSSLFIIGLITQKPMVDLLVMLTALFICIVPEGLPVVMTLVLISGAYKMTQRKVLVKNLQAVEALGRVNVIITDKTGTLTRNEMVVSHIFIDEQNLAVSGSGYFLKGEIENANAHRLSLNKIAQACIALNDTTIDFNEESQKFLVKGHPTQAAAFVFAQKVLRSKQLKDPIKFIYTIPFDSAYRYKAVFYEENQTHLVSVLGAPEAILAGCNNGNEKIHAQLESYLSQGYRVVAIAQKIYTHQNEATFADYQNIATSNLTFLGLLAISDEPRENLIEIIQQVHDANIQIVMATGDHKETALYVAKKVGIVDNDKNIITGKEFAQLTDQQAIKLLQDNFVCARFSPQDKLRLVQLFHLQGKIVATTGDGINDVPALVASDISIVMGSTGTQLTKQAGDIILLQDSFANIIDAIKQGHNMLYALRRTVLYFLTSNMGEVLIVFFALILSLPLPLLPAQILWLNLITDGFLDIALAMEPEQETKLLKNNHKQGQKIFDAKIIYKMFFLALPMSLIGLLTFMSMYKTDIALARTLTLVTLAMFQWFNALNCRSENTSIFKIGLFSNFWLVIATIAVFVLQLVVLYVPFMQHIFRTVPLSLHDWFYAVTVSSSVLLVEEMRKWIAQRFLHVEIDEAA